MLGHHYVLFCDASFGLLTCCDSASSEMQSVLAAEICAHRYLMHSCKIGLVHLC